MWTSSVVLAIIAAARVVHGHGGIYNYTIDGVEYPGHYPYLLEEDQDESIQRRWYMDPIQAVDHPWLSCRMGNPLQQSIPGLYAPIRAGRNVSVLYVPPELPANYWRPTEASTHWTNDTNPPTRPVGPEYPWVHSLGPLMVYMAPCPGSCEDFEPGADDKVWFKIFETHYHPNKTLGQNLGSSGSWDHFELANKGWSVQIPDNLKPGNYLIRHEIIMIELMPPQFYPNCAQLTVSGDGDALPDEEYLVSFPGAYKADDPGLAIAGWVYYPVGRETFNYTNPGPSIWPGF